MRQDPLLALAVRLQMDIARGHRRAALQRASSASQSSATAGCSGRSARQAAARPHCVVTLEARAAPPSGAESEQLECRCPTPRSSSRRASGCACLRRTTPPTTWLTATRDRLPRAARRRPCRRGCSCRHCSTPRSRLGQYNRIVAVWGTTQLSLHDFFGCADNLFLLRHLCSSGHGAWGQCVPCWGASKTPRVKQIRAGMPAQPPQMPSPKSTLDLGQGGRFAEGSGKRRKIWPRGRFGLIFGANPI